METTPKTEPETTPVADPQPEPEVMSVPDMVANAAQAMAAISEVVHRCTELYNQMQGVSAAARADLAFVMAVLNAAKAKL